MCLAVLAIDAHPRYALAIAANRDEFHARRSRAAHRWSDGIVAGRDEEAGGTWFGVAPGGRFAFVTNVREPGRRRDDASSRGELPLRVLRDGRDIVTATGDVAAIGERYNGFNLIAGDGGAVCYTSNRYPGPALLSRGVHGISNACLDERWPKVVRTVAAMNAWCEEGDADLGPLWALLEDRTVAPDPDLPATGLSRERERLLSAPFIRDAAYGTRASTLFVVTRDGRARFVERGFDPQGRHCGDFERDWRLADAIAGTPVATPAHPDGGSGAAVGGAA